MKQIHFDNIGESYLWKFLMTLSLIFFLVGIFEPFAFKDEKIYKYIISAGSLIQVVFYSKRFWFRNMIQWNKKGAAIKIKTLLSKGITFDEIKSVNLDDNLLTITKNNGKILNFDLNDFKESDIKKMKDVLINNTLLSI